MMSLEMHQSELSYTFLVEQKESLYTNPPTAIQL